MPAGSGYGGGMRASPILLVLVAGCTPLDSVPVFDGTACAPTRVDDVSCVLDGDTFQVGGCGGESVRLLGINAPEIAHDDSSAECYGDASAAWAADLLTGVSVTLKFDETCQDAYGRTLAYVYYTDDDGEERLFNETSVREGMSRVYEDFDDIKLAPVLYAAQDAAQRDGAGLWSACEDGS